MKEMGERSPGFLWELRHRVAVKVWEGLLQHLHLEFSEESRQNLLEANERLKRNSVVVYLNHTALMEDVELPVSMVLSFLTNAKRIIGPVAMKHYDPTRDWKNAMLLRLLKPLGIEVRPIVQPESIDEGATKYSDEEKRQMSAELRAATAKAVKDPGTVFGIAPEGTRSEKGTLLPARNGIGYLEAYDEDDRLSYLPVVIVLEKFSNHPKIEVGRPLRLGEMNIDKSMLSKEPKERAQFLADIHFLRIAAMLPPEMRGVYGEK